MEKDSPKKKKILVVSQYFYPEQFRINDICKELVKRNFDVTVLTGIPNYPYGKFFKGYGLFKKKKENWKNINIIRLPIIARGKNPISLILNYMSFVVSGFFWNMTTKEKADYVFNFEVSPMTQVLVGVWYAKKHKIPCYSYIQDLWPENVQIVAGINNNSIIKLIEKMVRYIYKKSDKIFATSPSFVKSIQAKCDDLSKVSYLPQYAEDFYIPANKEEVMKETSEIPNDDSFKIIFTGNIGKAQGLDILPQTAKLLEKENVKFIIVGDGREKDGFVAEIEHLGVKDKFVLIKRQPADKIPNLLACCDAAFVSFMNNELFSKTIPAKLQSYMACGMPIIASASGETQRIISEANCGMCCKIGDSQDLKDSIIELMKKDINTMGENSRKYYVDNFNKDDILKKLEQIFV